MSLSPTCLFLLDMGETLLVLLYDLLRDAERDREEADLLRE